MEYQIGGIATDFLSAEERSRLVGLCRKLTGNPDAAEDLAQETLLLAWRGIAGLREPEKRAQWIAGIARNVSLRWLRQQGREQARKIILPPNAEEPGTTTLEEMVADEFDLEVELERRELVTLLDRALALLPTETRAVLIKRYIEESPLAEIAAQLDTNASAVAMRLQRGKLALRKVLTSEMREEIASYEQAASEQTWEQTSLWCHLCGQHRLLGYKQPEHGSLYLKCPACSLGGVILSRNESIPALKGIKSFRPAYTRLSEWCHTYYRQGLRDGSMRCETCGRSMPVRISPPDEIRQLSWLDHETPEWLGQRNGRLVNGICVHCSSINCITLDTLALFLPEGRTFMRSQQRIRRLPHRTIEFAGRPAITTRFESVTESASFEVISDYETYEVLKIVEGVQ
jgi:RNA polymerase sigma factor (sigma-70 family)